MERYSTERCSLGSGASLFYGIKINKQKKFFARTLLIFLNISVIILLLR